MRRTGKAIGTLAAATSLAMVGSGLAVADTALVDIDTANAGPQRTMTLSATPGQVQTFPVDLWIDCKNEGGAAKRHMNGNTTLSYSTGSTVPAGGALTATGVTIMKPSKWPADGQDCESNTQSTSTVRSTATITAPSADGSYTYNLRYAANDTDVIVNQAAVAITLNVTTPAPVDSTPPDISYQLSAPDNNDGWHKANVTVTWSVQDLESAVTSTTGCGVQTVTVDTLAAGQLIGCSATSTGGTASDDVTIKLDKSAPNAPTISLSTPANSAGWHNDSVTATFSAAGDNGASGVASCSSEQTVSDEGRDQEVSGTCTDVAGNVSAPATESIDLDETAPNAPTADAGTPAYTDADGKKWFRGSATVTFTGTSDPDLADGSDGSGIVSTTAAATRSTTGALEASGTSTDAAGNESDATQMTVHVDAALPVVSATNCPTTPVVFGSTQSVSWTAVDTGSGVATAASGSVPLVTNAVGTQSVSLPMATDNVGNTSVAANCSYSVRYASTAVLQPINPDGSSRFKLGSAIPVKIKLTGASAGFGLASIGFQNAKVSNTTAGTELEATSTSAADSGSSLRYDQSNDQYIYNLSTKNLTAGTYTVSLNLNDGSPNRNATFSIVK